MNIFNNINDKLLKLIDDNQTRHVDQFIKDSLPIDDIIRRKVCNHIKIVGKQCSGKTTLLNKLLILLDGIVKHSYKLYLKHIKVIDSYNERGTFEELITFYKNIINKNEIKVLVIDDYNCFSKLFKSKVNSLLKQRSGIHISIIVGENGYNNNKTNKYLTTDNMFSHNLHEFIRSHLDNNYSIERDVVEYLLASFTETNNIKSLIHNINILSFMDFNNIDGMYFYNNVVESVYIHNCIYGESIDYNKLIHLLKEKYRNNENVKDTVLLIETSVFYIIQSALIKDNHKLEQELYKILNVCYDIKTRILHLKRSNKYISNKLLFTYFIMRLNKLYI